MKKQQLIDAIYGAINILKESGEEDFRELKRKEKKAFFEKFEDIVSDYDGDKDYTYAVVELDDVYFTFASNELHGFDKNDINDFWTDDYEGGTALERLQNALKSLNRPVEVVNLTPHELTILDENNNVIHRIPSSGFARAHQTREHIGDINGIPAYKTSFGEVEGLPAPQEDVIYVVSALTAQAAPHRDDLYIPDNQVRDAEGRIIGCRALGQI
ncbi:hypothetical protein [Paenibacillus larvae]|nr:hypothetical protein [Paenibacillus larvae]AVF26395.1 hypothetical protein ERICIII_02234 [Paenibacillus larvae subsp. larvae]AVF31172.1 hypothetical protein ERICIV_02255 [Paenibacillus larvae subsp. larvae]MCY7518970.1 hypothetical protein [Paenibacillus larvae]MCY9500419.1 hypothetical protein [Paenibacillus larvae]MCY9511419.1 hypothetical protein [Paenibacillus larvae]